MKKQKIQKLTPVKEAAIKEKAHQKIKDIINHIDELIPVKKVSEKEMICRFEQIDTFMLKQKVVGYTIILSEVATYMQLMKDKRAKRFDDYFKKVHAIIRKKAEKHPSYKENLLELNKNNFIESSKILNPKYYQICEYTPMNYDTAHAAYQKLLDYYDPNIATKKFGLNWSGFWSLISTKNGEIEGCYLSDTMDRELFYEYLKPIDYSIYRKNKKHGKK